MDSTKESKRYMKMTVFFKKKAGLTDEEFHRYWSDSHALLFKSLPVVQEKLVKYNQFHNSAEARTKAASLGLPVMEFDGAAEFWAEDMEAFMAVLQDPEYLQTVVPDEGKFLTREDSKIMFGYDELKFVRTESPKEHI